MPDPRQKRQRTQDRQARVEEQRRAELRRAQRKRALIGIAMVVVILAVLGGVLIKATQGSSTAASTSTSTTGDPLAELNSSTTSLPSGPPASLPTVPPGQASEGATGCPPLDGSAPRVTSFAQPPPMCIDVNATYDATMKTSVGDIKFLLNPEQTANGVNAFVVLAAYHYWDGAPITMIEPRSIFVIGNPNPSGPGFTIANDMPSVGAIYPIGTPALVAGAGDQVNPGSFQVAIGEQAADLPKNTPAFGLMLDGQSTLQAIRKAGSQSGAPTQAITITGIDLAPSPPPSNP